MDEGDGEWRNVWRMEQQTRHNVSNNSEKFFVVGPGWLTPVGLIDQT